MKKKVVSLVAIGMLALSGCSIGQSTEKQLSETLTKMNESETEYRTTQSKLTELEKTEQKTFTETMELTKEDVDKLRSKVGELEGLLDERLEHLDREEAAMKEAEAFVLELDTIIENASDSERNQIVKLKEAVLKRYDLHTSFVEEYRKLAAIQKEFYNMLSAENITLSELKQKVKDVNEQNEIVQTAISEFNEATKEVNSLKDDVFSSLEQEE
ncbi:YkyA family protein [Sporosarcina sp. ACRSL]|uniref:YkyA family protein n=1 Tax=Sporosarcina sp. ACRSL TaxID=2918215 RepID=UPI001EF43611|nr:YkyA family protein [Sporosarcina sp. ACRSL]MCG7342724.1 YkyA family protein [Sporosarcina sp. ACRSL]